MKFDRDMVIAAGHMGACVAPLGDVPDDPGPDDVIPLCGRDATTTRTVEGLVCPLCAEHAAEIDREAECEQS